LLGAGRKEPIRESKSIKGRGKRENPQKGEGFGKKFVWVGRKTRTSRLMRRLNRQEEGAHLTGERQVTNKQRKK